MFEKCFGISLDYLGYSGVSKDKQYLVLGRKDTSEKLKIIEMRGSPITKSKSYKFKLKQNNYTELLSISFHQLTINVSNNEERKTLKYRCPMFCLFFAHCNF